MTGATPAEVPALDAASAEACEAAFLAAVAAADPTKIVKAHVRKGLLDDWFGDLERPRMLHVLAVGKAAPRMLWGLVEANVPFRGLGVAPRGTRRTQVDTFTWHVGDHPVPGTGSFAAGRAVQAWCDGLSPDARVLVLLSGGASSVVEIPQGDEDTCVAQWRADLAAGLPIDELNRRRAARSAIKGGKLGKRVLARTPHVRVWVLSDVPPADAPDAVGSGPFVTPGIDHRVLADNEVSVEAAGAALADLGYRAYRFPRRLDGDVADEVDAFLTTFAETEGKRIALVAGGEPTVAVPADAPPGGRARHAALCAARWLSTHGRDGTFLAGATDGVDGVDTSAPVAGAWADAASWTPEAPAALKGHAAAALLEQQGRTIATGPTGTNVNDIWVAARA